MKHALLLLLSTTAFGQQSHLSLNLDEAERLAIQNSPRFDAARLRAEALGQQPAQYRANLMPQVTANLTGAGATTDSRIGAGALNNPIIYSRFASGITATQLVYDFGRTGELVNSASSRARAGSQYADATRADVLLRVHRAYLGALRSREIVRVAEQTVQARQLLTDQVKALADAKLKSGLDLSFAQVSLSEAKLLRESAANERLAADAALSAALGLPGVTTFDLEDVDSPPVSGLDPDELISEALRKRPDLEARRSEVQAARQFAEAERKLKYPTIAAIGSAGVIPARVDGLKSADYVAGGINLGLPFLNGGLFKARAAEAQLRARAAEKDVTDMQIETGRAVRTAVLGVTTAAARVDLARQLLTHAEQSLDLAKARYDLGLSSIVELSQAELARTSAQLQATNAKYDYILQRSILRFETGSLR
jgi:outer membrane protein